MSTYVHGSVRSFRILPRQSVSKAGYAVPQSFGAWQSVPVGPRKGLEGLGFAGSETRTEQVVAGNGLGLCVITNTEWTSGQGRLAAEQVQKGRKMGQLKRMLGLEIMCTKHQLGDNVDDRQVMISDSFLGVSHVTGCRGGTRVQELEPWAEPDRAHRCLCQAWKPCSSRVFGGLLPWAHRVVPVGPGPPPPNVQPAGGPWKAPVLSPAGLSGAFWSSALHRRWLLHLAIKCW